MKSTAEPDDATETFTITASGSAEIVGFKGSELFELIRRYVENLNSFTVVPGKIDISYGNISFNKADKILKFDVNVSGNSYFKFDTQKMASDMAGMSRSRAADYLKEAQGIDSARLRLTPFWLRKVPTDRNRIEFVVNY